MEKLLLNLPSLSEVQAVPGAEKKIVKNPPNLSSPLLPSALDWFVWTWDWAIQCLNTARSPAWVLVVVTRLALEKARGGQTSWFGPPVTSLASVLHLTHTQVNVTDVDPAIINISN